jgi:hypothetical protein
MTHRVAVGIHPDSSYYPQVLEQLGIPWLPVTSLNDGIAQGIRVFLWNGPTDMQAMNLALGERLAVIANSGSCYSNAPTNGESAIRSYYFKLPGGLPFAAQSFFVNLPVIQTAEESFGTCYDRDNCEISNSGIEIIEKDDHLAVSFPWDISSYEQGVDWAPRPYFSTSAGKHFVEVGPALDVGAFRRLLLEVLLYCFNWVRLPLVRVSPFYKNKRYFSFRVDADGFSESSTEAGLRIAKNSGLRFTWFLDMSGWRSKKPWIAQLMKHNQDIQFHCFRHMTYASKSVNDVNIQRGIREIAKSGVTPRAIVSPLGYYSRGFSDAIREQGFAFSSEFGYAVDDLPSRPRNDRLCPLQIPVHPACSGVFRQAGFTSDEQFLHLRNIVQRRCSTDGFCIIYDHPIDGLEANETRYIELFNELAGSVEYISMFEYYRAWIERAHNPRIVYEADGQLHIDKFDENGFRLEQVTDRVCNPARWRNAALPQVRLQEPTEEFCYPPERIREMAYKRGMLNMKERNFSKSEWYLHELFLSLGTRTGYFQCRQSLAGVGWLRAFRDRIRG